MNHHVFLVEIATEETDRISQRDLAREIALVLAHHGTCLFVESIRPVAFRSRTDVDAETGEVCRD